MIDFYLFQEFQALSFNEVIQNNLAKIPNSLPVVRNFTVKSIDSNNPFLLKLLNLLIFLCQVNIQENGEVGDHSKSPRFYSSPVPSNGNKYFLIIIQAIQEWFAVFFYPYPTAGFAYYY